MGIPHYSSSGFSPAACENSYWTPQPPPNWFQTHYPIMTEVVEDVHSLAPSSPQSDNDSTNSSNLSDSQISFKIRSHESDNECDRTSHVDFKCRWKNCRSVLGTLNSLSNHVATTHSDANGGLFYCGWEGCSRGNKGFNARYKMLVHVRTHTNEKPHKCNQCDKSFSRAENLKIHTRSHSGEKPYICPVEGCNKAYSNSSDRFKHTRTHAVDKPYCCKIPGCQKRYTDPSSLRKHVKTYKHITSPTVDRISIDVEYIEYNPNERVAMPERDVKYGKRKYSYSENDIYDNTKNGLNKRQASSSDRLNNSQDTYTEFTVDSKFLINKMECQENIIGGGEPRGNEFNYQYSEEPLDLKRYSEDVYENGVLNLGRKGERSDYFIDHTLADIPLDLSLRKSFS